MENKEIARNYRFLAILLGAMIAGCIVGWAAPEFAVKLKPFGTYFPPDFLIFNKVSCTSA